ncbi:GNAT family N-acetyltransferase [Actimicrobium sp. CCI2.3]|uniref:GNAT family N-acetyltransferase n=1 Tax=Actimicrobium sp. CCI2.3 TaxID=3048616 RepID=UPI002AB42378|nr:GNAT family N-acetyltransferase [Actimicrobium sp. CCI2.3]MDY7573243.1 GNAT family N-acetyltransferase [Actimicrobium sp. CCI2.3]MEB0022877.1 GNAT family N-acetyltransferase [Actimicrobium sp. CCI2.3]
MTLPEHLATEWQWSTFDQLGVHHLYALLALRQDVFIVEQACLFQDIDGIDQASWHLLGWQVRDGKPALVAYLRCVPPGVKYPEAAIGRVVSAASVRGTGLGRELFAQGLARTLQVYPGQAIRLAAQQRLEPFYARFGFVTCSAAYLEDDIWHVDMLRAAGS